MTDASLLVLAAQTVLQEHMNVVADNVANASTHGYKREELMFADYLDKVGTTEEASLDIRQDFREGELTHTGNPLDLAIAGDGFFTVETPEGIRYGRNGRFSIDVDGNLVNGEGHKVLGDNGAPIAFAPTDTDIVISPDGKVLASGGTIGTLDLARFDDTTKLERAGAGLYLAAGALPAPADEARVIQGAVEESNVLPILEVTRMMRITHNYQAVQRITETDQELVRRTIQVLTQV